MKIGIMQPYFLPYIGYWQLLNEVDKFVVYDNIQFTKKSWIRRNRILQNGKDSLFTISIEDESDFLDIRDRCVSNQYFSKDVINIINKVENAYQKAPYFKEVMPILEQCFLCKEKNLFEFIFNSIKIISKHLGITTEIIISSQIEMDHSLKSQDRVIEICKQLAALSYINPIGGLELYDKKTFGANGIELKFIKSKDIGYKQFNNEFVPWLSIIDVMMFNSKDEIKKLLNMYELL